VLTVTLHDILTISFLLTSNGQQVIINYTLNWAGLRR